MVTVPVRWPPAVGVKVTWIAQLVAASNVAGQLFVCEKSPEIATLLMVILPVTLAFATSKTAG